MELEELYERITRKFTELTPLSKEVNLLEEMTGDPEVHPDIEEVLNYGMEDFLASNRP